MVSTTGEQFAYYVLDDDLVPQPPRRSPSGSPPTVALIAENCEPSLATVLFVGGAGGSLRAGVTANPVRLTRAVQRRADPRSPAAARRSMSGPAAASPSWST